MSAFSSIQLLSHRKVLLVAAAATSLALAACASDGGGAGGGDDGETTTGKRVTFDTVVTRKGELTFTNEEGWNVTLTRALVSVGPFYYFEGEPIESATEALLIPPPAHRSVWERASDLLIGTAHAHPGHYVEGSAHGEMLTAASVDLVAGTTPIAAGEGITGLIRSARFGWTSPAQGAFAADLGTLVALVEGHAVKEDEERWFRLEATPTEALDAAQKLQVEGCVFDAIDVEDGGTVTVSIDPSVWLAGSDFAEAPEGAEGAPEVVPVGTQPFNAFERGLKKGGGYHFTFTAK